MSTRQSDGNHSRSMTKIRRIDFSPDEWLSGAFSLKADQRGCYITIIMLIYSHGGPILDVDKELSYACNVTIEKWRAIRSALLAKGKIFITEDGRISNGRCETELEKATNRTERARENGAEGGRKSAESRAKPVRFRSETGQVSVRNRSETGQKFAENQSEINQNPIAESININALHEADASFENEANHQLPTTNHQLPTVDPPIVPHPEPPREPLEERPPKVRKRKVPDGIPASVVTGFNAWYAAYPIQKGPEAAIKAYHRVLKTGKATECELLEAAARFAVSVAGKDPQYIAHPTTWLNQGRWKDAPDPPYLPAARTNGFREGGIMEANRLVHDLIDRNGGTLPDSILGPGRRVGQPPTSQTTDMFDDPEIPF